MSGSEPVSSRRDRRRVETRDRIFEAATELFTERGFDTVTVEMITERVDVGKGTFFNYFSSKEAVVAYYFQSQCQLASEMIADTNVRGAALCAWDDLVRIVHTTAERAGRSRPFARMLLALSLTNEKVRLANHETDLNARTIGLQLIARAQVQGEIRADLDPDQIAKYISTGYFGILCCWASSEDDQDLHQEIDRQFAIMRDGLLVPSDASR